MPSRRELCTELTVTRGCCRLLGQHPRDDAARTPFTFEERNQMGLFDSLFGGLEGSKRLTSQEAFAGMLLGASACDGHIADDEVDSLITILVRMKLYKRYDPKQFNQTLNKLFGVVKKKGVEFLIDGCVEALPDELRETAFANACDIVLADGVVEPDEKEFIEMIRTKLKIQKQQALEIVQIMVVKNKG